MSEEAKEEKGNENEVVAASTTNIDTSLMLAQFRGTMGWSIATRLIMLAHVLESEAAQAAAEFGARVPGAEPEMVTQTVFEAISEDGVELFSQIQEHLNPMSIVLNILQTAEVLKDVYKITDEALETYNAEVLEKIKEMESAAADTKLEGEIADTTAPAPAAKAPDADKSATIIEFSEAKDVI